MDLAPAPALGNLKRHGETKQRGEINDARLAAGSADDDVSVTRHEKVLDSTGCRCQGWTQREVLASSVFAG